MDFTKRFAALRRKVIGLDFAHLNENQLEAVLVTKGPLLLLAGAGSGKTAVLMNRIVNLIKYGNGSDSEFVPDGYTEDDLHFLEEYAKAPSDDKRDNARCLCAVEPVEPWRIIAITFTNKAANEMKERLKRLLGDEVAEDVRASTFHSACVRFLRRDIDRMGYDRSFAIYDTTDSASLIKRIMKELNIEDNSFTPKTVLGYISRAKDNMQSAADFAAANEKSSDLRRKVIGAVYFEYEKRMRESNALDFDDLILLTVRLFKEHPDVLQHYQKRYKHVLIEEYQDTNKLQYILASSLAGGYGNICVVGDDDQSIYKFRGATIENILNFEKHFEDARVIRLEQNYRSTAMIINAAADVICNNKGRKGKALWTKNEHGEKPALHVVSDERAEAQFVADTIISSVASGKKWSEHAVLYRMNAQSNQFETAFKRAGIPYRVYGGIGFYERAEIKDMLAYLCVLHNPHDDVRLLRIINNPVRGIGATTIGRLSELSGELGKTIFEIIRESQNHDLIKSSAGKLHKFADMIDELRLLAGSVTLDVLYDELINRTGYIRALEEKNLNENIARIENVRELKTNIISFMKASSGSLFEFLSETALYSDLDRDDSSAERVMLMTMHSAKGLEFDTVFIVGAEDGVFPSSRTLGDFAELEEERRLCYVAMTRAMRRLYFTSAQRRMLFGKTSPAQKSRFLREIRAENIETHEPSYSFDDNFVIEDSGWDDFEVRSKPNGRSYGGASQRRTAPWERQSQGYLDSKQEPRAARYENKLPSPTVKAQETVNKNYAKGDAIVHTAFGNGVITDYKPAGNDALLVITFDDGSVKKFMLNTASRSMRKL